VYRIEYIEDILVTPNPWNAFTPTYPHGSKVTMLQGSLPEPPYP
jgi:hypothetical protein